MREIKFRAFDVNEEMHYFELDAKTLRDGVSENFKYILWQEEGYELMQYTGLKDKSGKEIYEGDILAEDVININVVIWDKYRWNIKEFYAPSYDSPDSAFSERMIFEIIGNIHEHPELIK